MNKERGKFLYDLVGIIREKKKIYNDKRIGYRLIVNIHNVDNISYLQVWQDLIANQQIWTDLESNKFLDKRYSIWVSKLNGTISLN